MAKFSIAALGIVAALIMSFGAFSGTRNAEAAPTATSAVWCGFIISIVDCTDGVDAAEVIDLGDALGDEDGSLEVADLDEVDLDLNQVTDEAAPATLLDQILIFAFVNNDGIVDFDSDAGATVMVSDSSGGFSADPDLDPETCTTEDEDCDDAVDDDGDGVVVATIFDGTAEAGDDVEVDVIQDSTSLTETLSIVGPGDDIVMTLVESVIETDAGNDCGDLEVTDDDALGNPDSTIVIVAVTDNDGTNVTREAVDIAISDSDIAFLGDETVVSVDGGASGVAYFAVICGGDDTGVVDVDATGAGEDVTAELTVVGPAANVTLTASPAAIACDGTATATVSATVTDSDGNNVANGSDVNFSVVALGTANPINTTTIDGVASSTITPLSGATAGVTVIVSAGDAQASIRVDCLLSLATPVGPAPTPTAGTGVTPPDTGNGGYLGQDSSAGFPLWTLVALALGSVALVAGGLVTRRAGL